MEITIGVKSLKESRSRLRERFLRVYRFELRELSKTASDIGLSYTSLYNFVNSIKNDFRYVTLCKIEDYVIKKEKEYADCLNQLSLDSYEKKDNL